MGRREVSSINPKLMGVGCLRTYVRIMPICGIVPPRSTSALASPPARAVSFGQRKPAGYAGGFEVIASAALRARRSAGGCASGIVAAASYRKLLGVIVRPKILQHFLEVSDREHK
jgi:hypothetical protein